MEHVDDEIDIRSEAVRDFLSQPPKWLIRWGNWSILLILLVAFSIGWIVHYPTIISTEFRLISDNLPKAIVLKTDGRIEKLFVKDNQQVEKGEILAYVESTSNHNEILDLERELDKVKSIVRRKNLSNLRSIRLSNFEHLGEIQSAYQVFQQSFVQIKALYGDEFYLRKRQLMLEDIKRAEIMDIHLDEQGKLYAKDLELAEKEYMVSKKLHTQRVIADLDIYREESKALAKQLPIKNIETSRINNDTQRNAKKNEILELDKAVAEQTEIFEQVINTLASAVETWKSRYLLQASEKGTVYFSTILQEKQVLRTGVEVMFIGSGSKKFLGEIHVPQNNFGKVKLAQRVLVKFQAYPFEEYGAVEGKIISIAKVPSTDNTYFLATVSLPNGLTTNFNKTLVYKTGMAASGEIITEDLRLFERLFYQIRRIFMTR